MIASLLVAASLAAGPDRMPSIVDRVDLIEINHVIDCNVGREQFEQIIVWQWDVVAGRYEVVAWRQWRADRPTPQRTCDGWRLRFRDGVNWREIHSPLFRETWTDHDAEFVEREKSPDRWRPGLTGKPLSLLSPQVEVAP